jgi:hypothetical protein
MDLCSNNDTTNGKTLLLIKFGFGSDQYSNKTPSSFNFSTTHQQQSESLTEDGMFSFVNAVAKNNDAWHAGASDSTPNDDGGYMFFINIAENDSQLFNSTVNNLCIGLRYEFSAFLANVIKKTMNPTYKKPKIRFEVRTTTIHSHGLTQLTTDDIPEYENMTWTKYGLSFIASSSSVVLLMISDIEEGGGNDIAIDDIELRACSTIQSDSCPSS